MAKQQLIDLEGAVFLRREVRATGVTDHQIALLVRTGEWHRIRRGAYCAGALWRSLGAADRHRLLARAVLRTAHASTVLTHVSAAIEHGAPVWGIPLDEVHTTRTDGKAARREAGKVHHRGVLPEDQVQQVNGVPVSAPVRCALEVSTIATLESALVTVNGLLHAGLMTPDELAAQAHDCRFWPQTLHATLLVRMADPRIESVGETRTLHLCWAEHLPKPQPQVVVQDERGRLFARVDFAWPEHGVFLEFDGREKYTLFRREGETLEQFLMREKTREERICQLTGWVCLRISWADLANPAATARRIRAVLDSRSQPVGA
jgi:hypothetical protein